MFISTCCSKQETALVTFYLPQVFEWLPQLTENYSYHLLLKIMKPQLQYGSLLQTSKWALPRNKIHSEY